ncbi:hypothetical protein OEA41_006580 [Lepraria neglecta]|uniref:Uncharacterized protein n=1 Tax=Lepraria neglecta TaxID=209136 RepID=A0AAD9Z835_9LECA|nr:hypothetical protein OEA41_006580 [Lepraria neglecta]
MSSPNIITIGHNADGLSIFIDNPQHKNFFSNVGILYSTASSEPIDLNKNADISAFENRDHAGLIPNGETRLIKQGDVLLQRGTMHAWKNPSGTETPRMLCFVLPSQPVEGAKEKV